NALIGERLGVIAGDRSTGDIRRWKPVLVSVESAVGPKSHPGNPAGADVAERIKGQCRALEQLTGPGVVLFEECGFARMWAAGARVHLATRPERKIHEIEEAVIGWPIDNDILDRPCSAVEA